MHITLPPAPGGRPLVLELPRLGLPLKAGQQLDALVLGAGSGDGRVRLDVAGRVVEAHTTLSLLTGQSLKIQVESAGPPPQLRLLLPDRSEGVPIRLLPAGPARPEGPPGQAAQTPPPGAPTGVKAESVPAPPGSGAPAVGSGAANAPGKPANAPRTGTAPGQPSAPGTSPHTAPRATGGDVAAAARAVAADPGRVPVPGAPAARPPAAGTPPLPPQAAAPGAPVRPGAGAAPPPHGFAIAGTAPSGTAPAVTLPPQATPAAGAASLPRLPPSDKPLLLVIKGLPPLPLRPGQTLPARVLEVSPKGVTVELAGARLSVGGASGSEAAQRLQPGDTVRFRIERTGTQLTVLRADPPQRTAEVLAASARTALPRQLPLVPVADGAVQVTRSPDFARLPPPVQAVVAQAAQRLGVPVEKLATPEGLRAAITHSGLFLESNLVRAGERAAAGDSKAVLLRLAAVLIRYLNRVENAAQQAQPGRTAPPPAQTSREAGGEPPPEMQRQPPQAARPEQAPAQERSGPPRLPILDALREVARQAEGASARLQLNQATALAKEDSPNHALAIELPVRQGDRHETLELKVRRGCRGGGGEPVWSVDLHLEDERHGPMHFVVTLLGGAISTGIWAEQQATADLFRRHLPELEQRLREQGLTVGRLAAFVGKPPKDRDTDADDPLWHHLLDVQA